MNQLDMQGRGAIVTGGAAGIGYAIAQRLVASRARVSLWDRDHCTATAGVARGIRHTHLTSLVRTQLPVPARQPRTGTTAGASCTPHHRPEHNGAAVSGPREKCRHQPAGVFLAGRYCA